MVVILCKFNEGHNFINKTSKYFWKIFFVWIQRLYHVSHEKKVSFWTRCVMSSVNDIPWRIICLRITVTILHLFYFFTAHSSFSPRLHSKDVLLSEIIFILLLTIWSWLLFDFTSICWHWWANKIFWNFLYAKGYVFCFSNSPLNRFHI